MLEGLFNQIANKLPPKVPSIPSPRSQMEPLQARVCRPVPWVPLVHPEKHKTQNTQPLSEQDRQKIFGYLAAIGETDQEIIQEILEVCGSNSGKRVWLLQWVDKILPAPEIDLLND